MIVPFGLMRTKKVPMIDATIETAPSAMRHAERERHAGLTERKDADEHRCDGGDDVGLEEVGGHAGAVTDVVTDVVGDDGRVAGVVLGDAGLDLADEVGAHVGGLGEDAAAETGEDRDERATEAETDECRGRSDSHRDQDRHDRHRQDAEPDDEQAGDATGLKRDVERLAADRRARPQRSVRSPEPRCPCR